MVAKGFVASSSQPNEANAKVFVASTSKSAETKVSNTGNANNSSANATNPSANANSFGPGPNANKVQASMPKGQQGKGKASHKANPLAHPIAGNSVKALPKPHADMKAIVSPSSPNQSTVPKKPNGASSKTPSTGSPKPATFDPVSTEDPIDSKSKSEASTSNPRRPPRNVDKADLQAQRRQLGAALGALGGGGGRRGRDRGKAKEYTSNPGSNTSPSDSKNQPPSQKKSTLEKGSTAT